MKPNDLSYVFAQNFQQCCAESYYHLAFQEQQQSEEYASASQECDALFDSIQSKLGDDRDLISTYDAARNNLLSLSDESIYQQGYRDCIYLLQWMGLL